MIVDIPMTIFAMDASPTPLQIAIASDLCNMEFHIFFVIYSLYIFIQAIAIC